MRSTVFSTLPMDTLNQFKNSNILNKTFITPKTNN